MKKIKLLLLINLFFINVNCNIQPNIEIKQVVIWGHKLHSHTHSYIHAAFFKAFEYLGYKVLWLDDNDKVDGLDFSKSLFITEGQADKKIPLLNDCFYILHNCNYQKYKKFFENNNCISLQVYTNDCIGRNLQKFNDFVLYNVEQKIIYMPWATDLLPHEIDANKKNMMVQKENKIYWIGTIGKGEFGNHDEINGFVKACKENDIEFINSVCDKSPEESLKLIKKSYMAPAIQGNWQCQKGYIPCRIFKNISYGHIGITNNQTVYKLFKDKIIYNNDTYKLFYQTKTKLDNFEINELYELMDFVRDNHTYLNRINDLFKFINLVKNEKTK